MTEYIVQGSNWKVVIVALYEGNLYHMNFAEVHEADVANLVQSSTKDGALKLWHCRLGQLNMKSVHTLQRIMSGMKLAKIIHATSLLVCEAYIDCK